MVAGDIWRNENWRVRPKGKMLGNRIDDVVKYKQEIDRGTE